MRTSNPELLICDCINTINKFTKILIINKIVIAHINICMKTISWSLFLIIQNVHFHIISIVTDFFILKSCPFMIFISH